MTFIPQQGAGAYIPESMLQMPAYQPAGYQNPTGITAYQPDFNQFFNPGYMLQQPVREPSFTSGMFTPSEGENIQEPQSPLQAAAVQDNSIKSLTDIVNSSFPGGDK